ncbi:hypothetical protein V7161_24535 [Neobacillus drentensis]
MVKNKNKQLKNNNAMPKADVEFAGESGLAKKALKAQKNQNK